MPAPAPVLESRSKWWKRIKELVEQSRPRRLSDVFKAKVKLSGQVERVDAEKGEGTSALSLVTKKAMVGSELRRSCGSPASI